MIYTFQNAWKKNRKNKQL